MSILHDVVQPDVNGEFPTPADGAIWMLVTHGIPQTPLNGKAPFLSGWNKSENLLTTPEGIRGAAEKYRGCNFGSVFRKDFFACESDTPPDGIKKLNERFREFSGGEAFTSPLKIQSSSAERGHRYYKWVQGVENIGQSGVATKHGDFSLRVSGEQCVSPGSVHPATGKQYRVISSGPLTPPTEKEIAFWNSERVDAKPKSVEQPTERRLLKHGQMHGAYISEAGRLWNRGYEADDVVEMTVKYMHANSADSVDEGKVRKEALNVTKLYERGAAPETFQLELSSVVQQQKATAEEAARPLVVVNGDEFLAEKIPPRKVLVHTISGAEPVIYEQSINQIFAWRGVGKTCLGLGFVRCMATGGHFLNFRSEQRVPVLYVEGELPDSQIQERWKSIVGKTEGYAHLATIDKQPGHRYSSLATEAGMAKIEKALEDLRVKGIDIKVLMLDNISTLFNIGANEEEAWIPIQAWFTSLRSRGLTIFFFHHAGKQGMSRSHSKSEDMLDVSINLEAPEEQEAGHLHAVMTFDKARAGLSERPAEIKLHRAHSDNCECMGLGGFCPGDESRWEYIPVKSPRAEAERLFAVGYSIPQVMQETGAAEGTVRRWRTEWGKKHHAKVVEMPKSA